MLEDVLSSPLVPKVAKLIAQRLGRKLEPFEVWYAGFKPRLKHTEAGLDEIVRKKYPTPEAYANDIPNLLQRLGFSPEKAANLAGNIEVHPRAARATPSAPERRASRRICERASRRTA